MVVVDAAQPGEADALTVLALASKRHWGYDDEFMTRCEAELTVHESDLSTHEVFVARDGNAVLGFYLLIARGTEVAELDMLFVEPGSIGTGVGRELLHHALAVARATGCTHVRVTSDPFAAPFYERGGARVIGSARSGSTGRELPLYEFAL
ncbi:MAG: GNAT family N-acetyltransferase [Acidimicrobiales bacterium]